jgi:hypothetical protein
MQVGEKCTLQIYFGKNAAFAEFTKGLPGSDSASPLLYGEGYVEAHGPGSEQRFTHPVKLGAGIRNERTLRSPRRVQAVSAGRVKAGIS